MDDICKVESCHNPRDRKGWCTKHYMRARRNGGDPLSGRTETGAPLEFLKNTLEVKKDECVIWPFNRNKRTGYGFVIFNGHPTTAHRAALILSKGEPPSSDMQAAHLPIVCKSRLCVNPRHLMWATRKMNERHKLIAGTKMIGTRNHNSRLSPDQVRYIRSSKKQIKDLSTEIGLNRNAISRVKRRLSYRDVE